MRRWATTDEARTFRLDCLRGVTDGIVQSVAQSVALLIAVKVFAAGDELKALVAAAPFAGNIASLFYSARFSNARWRKSTLAAAPVVLCALGLSVAAWLPTARGYVVAMSVGVMFFMLRLTFLSSIYHDNYAVERRGVLFSRGALFAIVTTLSTSFLAGRALDYDLGNYRAVVLIASIAAAVSALSIRAMPSSVPRAAGMSNPLRNLGVVLRDRSFGYMIFVWFVFGFANLWVTPLRVVYLAEPGFGLDLSPFEVLLISSVVIETARLLFTPLWAILFDRINFVLMRMLLNGLLAGGNLLYFITRDPRVIALGSFLLGAGFAGGGIAWNLWVTRYSRRGETHVYMSVHTFFTGVRGVVGPYLGFLFVRHFSIPTIGVVSASVIAVSILLFAPALRMGARPEQSVEPLAIPNPD